MSLKVIQVSPTTIIGQDAAVDCAANHRNLGVGNHTFARPAADVKRSHSICICLEPASNALEIMEVSAVSFVHEITSGTCLRGVACAHGFNGYSFLHGFMFEGEPQEPVGDSVHLLARTFAPLAPTLPQVFEVLDCYSGVELLCQFDQLAHELPASRSRVVPLPSAEALELLASFALTMCVSMGLKLRPSSLKLRLHPRQVLPKIELLQYFALGATDGYGNAASVDVHPQHIRAFSLLWIVLSQGDEELEIGLHNHGANLPASPEVGLEPTPTPILSNGQTNPFGICANAQSWVTPSSGFEAEEAPVEADDYIVNPIGGLANSPGVTLGLAYKLRCNAEPLSVLAVGQAVQFGAAFDFAGLDQSEAFLGHLEEGAVGFSEFRPLDLGQWERIQDEAFLHGYQFLSNYLLSSDFRGEVAESIQSQFLPTLKGGVSFGCFR